MKTKTCLQMFDFEHGKETWKSLQGDKKNTQNTFTTNILFYEIINFVKCVHSLTLEFTSCISRTHNYNEQILFFYNSLIWSGTNFFQ